MAKEYYHVISNTHWDREWYQSHEKYLVRLVELMDRLLDILDLQPDYRFVTDGQFALVEDYLAAKPENTERVRRLVTVGQLLIGPWYTQPLENIVGGEALIRNLKKGITASEAFGGAMRFSYEIDEFGHTSQLPQILAGFGISGIMAWRGVPNHCRSYFRWAAPDGTTADFFNSNAGYGEATALPSSIEDFTEIIDGTPIEREGLRRHVERIRTLRLSVSDSRHMLWLNGIDHSWAQADILEVCRKVEALFPDLSVRQSTPQAYAEAVIRDLRERNITPETYTGELLYTNEPVLESTNALHPKQKRRHFEAERLLVGSVEPLTGFASALGFAYPAWAVERAWKYVLENHAHDSLGCCSVDEVYEQVMARYGASLSLSEQICDNALRSIMSCGAIEPSLWLFNLSETDRQGAVRVTMDVPSGFGGEQITLETADGIPVRMCVLSTDTNGDVRYNPRLGHPTWGEVGHIEAIVDAPCIPAYGAVRLRLCKAVPSAVPHNRQESYFVREANVLENDLLSVRVASDGTFTLTDKRNGAVYPSALLFTDDGEAGNCYVHIEPQNDNRRLTSRGANAQISTLYDTPLGAALEITVRMDIPAGLTKDRKRRSDETAPLVIRTVLALEKDAAAIRLHITLDNASRNHRVRVLFPSCLAQASVSESGQAFDEVERPISIPDEADLAEMPYLTHPMQEYCAVRMADRGLAVAARGIYEYECTDNDQRALALTLLRSIEMIDNETFEKTPEYFMEAAQNIGRLEHGLTLIPFDGTREALSKAVSAAIRPPFARVNRDTEDSVMPDYVRPTTTLADVFRAVELCGTGLTVTAFKRADSGNGLIVRVRSRASQSVNGSLTLHVPTGGKIYLADLEENLHEQIGTGNTVTFRIPSHKLMTFAFTE